GRFYPPCQYGPRASSWPQHATGTFSLTRALNLSASSPSEMAPTFFTSSSSAHISVKALLGSCGSEPLRELCAPSSEGAFTVNSSLSAVPVYQAFGFAP